TAHKAQGQTMNKVIVDLSSCVGTEAAYVMVSRCTHLDGLLVLRPFPISKITVRRSQDAREEFHRLERLSRHIAETDQNTQAGGNGEDNVSAISALFTLDTNLNVWAAGRLLNRIWDGRGANCVSRLPFFCDPRPHTLHSVYKQEDFRRCTEHKHPHNQTTETPVKHYPRFLLAIFIDSGHFESPHLPCAVPFCSPVSNNLHLPPS
ncbi:hypothetical protein BDM02DRAFT_3105726, partial [Thelephora ganbajun]